MAGLMSKVAFASKVSVLMKTTADNTNPTPGYLYEEVAKISYESVEYCDHMVDFLLDRLKKKSLHVKLKVLLVIRNVLEKGSSEFTRSLRKHSEEIKEMRSFFGPPDPLLGDSVYVHIRKTAAEALEIIFDSDRNISTYGSSVKNVGQDSAPPNMEGFGVSSADDGGIFKSIIGKIKDTVPNIKSATSNIIPTQPSDNKDYQFYAGNEKPAVSLPSTTLWGFGNTSDTNSESKTDSFGAKQHNASLNWLAKKTNDIALPQHHKYQIDLHENEKRIVEELVIPKGIRNQPTAQDMYQFLQKCESLDCEVIVKLLSQKLLHQDSRIQLRSMFIMESLLQSHLPNICNIVKDNCSHQLKIFLTSSHLSTRDKAEKVLQLVNKEENSQIMPNKNSENVTLPNQSETLLDLLSQQQNEDVFDGLQIQEKPKVQMKSMDIFKTKNNFNSQSTTSNPFDFQATNNNAGKSDLLDLDLDPFSSFTPMGTSKDCDRTSAMNSSIIPWSNNQEKVVSGKTTEEGFIFNRHVCEPASKVEQYCDLGIEVNTNFHPVLTFNDKEKTKGVSSSPLNFNEEIKRHDYISEKVADDISESSNYFIADFNNLSTTPSNQLCSTEGNTPDDMIHLTKSNIGIINQRQNVLSSARTFSPNNSAKSTTYSSDLFDGLQMSASPNVLMNKSNSSLSQSSFASNLNISNVKDKNNFSQISSNSFDSPSFSHNSPMNVSMNVSPQQMSNVQMRHQFQPSEKIYNQSNSIPTWQPQNMSPTGMNRPHLQMHNNLRNFSPQTFQSRTPRSNFPQFQQRLGTTMPVRCPSPNKIQSQRYVAPNIADGNSSNNTFNFLSQKSVEGKSSNDTFNFVQDAMRASIKK